MTGPSFDRDFSPRHGELVSVSPLVSRVTAANPGPFTFHGTNSYIVGSADGAVAIVDPGPDIGVHRQVLVAAVGTRPVSHILLTHTHVDHTPLARPLADHFGAPLVGCGPHRAARDLAAGEINPLEASSDTSHQPDIELADGDVIEADGFSLSAVATPGHTANHLAFLLHEEHALLSGDHVMAWSTSIVAPPDGSMHDYMVSLARTRDLDTTICWPGHGGPITDPRPFHHGLIAHRKSREDDALKSLAKGPATIAALVPVIYAGLDPRLFGAAGLSLLAHLEDLAERGIVTADETPSENAVWRLA